MAKNDFSEGWIDRFSIIKKNDAWMLEVSFGDAPAICRCITAARGGERYFQTIEAAVKVAEQIGFSVHALKFEKI